MRNQTTMRIVRSPLLGLAGLGAAGWLSASLRAGGQATTKAPHPMPMPSKGTMTKDQKMTFVNVFPRWNTTFLIFYFLVADTGTRGPVAVPWHLHAILTALSPLRTTAHFSCPLSPLTPNSPKRFAPRAMRNACAAPIRD